MVHMDACHLLLGHPWQFDRKVKHDRFKNTYNFKKDGVTITLCPNPDLRRDSMIAALKAVESNNLLKKSAFVAPVEEAKIFFCVSIS